MGQENPRPELVPGPDGTPVPDGLRLIRLANRPLPPSLGPGVARLEARGEASPRFFDLSSEDRKQPVPRLSVWIEALTTVAEAWDLSGANPRRNVVLFLDSAKVRTISAEAHGDSPPTPPLDVHWERAMTLDAAGQRIPETRPGAWGHAGIANLEKGNRIQRELLRQQLADIATVRILGDADLARFGTA